MVFLIWVSPRLFSIPDCSPKPHISLSPPDVSHPRGSHTHHSYLLCGKPRGQRGREGNYKGCQGGERPPPNSSEPQLARLPPPCLSSCPDEPCRRFFNRRGTGRSHSRTHHLLTSPSGAGLMAGAPGEFPAPPPPTPRVYAGLSDAPALGTVPACKGPSSWALVPDLNLLPQLCSMATVHPRLCLLKAVSLGACLRP